VCERLAQCSGTYLARYVHEYNRVRPLVRERRRHVQQRRRTRFHAHVDCRFDGDEYHGHQGRGSYLRVCIHTNRTRIPADRLAAASEEPASAVPFAFPTTVTAFAVAFATASSATAFAFAVPASSAP
jgi:hypothetical protein